MPSKPRRFECDQISEKAPTYLCYHGHRLQNRVSDLIQQYVIAVTESFCNITIWYFGPRSRTSPPVASDTSPVCSSSLLDRLIDFPTVVKTTQDGIRGCASLTLYTILCTVVDSHQSSSYLSKACICLYCSSAGSECRDSRV